MASTVWKGYITFGLISIPVRLFAAARDRRVSFNQVHRECGSRIKQQLFCPVCDRVVERSEVGRGYPVDKERFVMVEDEEIRKAAPASSDVMEIQEFVRVAEIDPVYYDMSYWVAPEDPGRRAYALLRETMEKSGYAAVAKIAMHQREYTVVIRPRASGLTLHTIFYQDEVGEVPEQGSLQGIEVKPQEVALAGQLVESLAAKFEPQKYHDEFQRKITELIEAKTAGTEFREAPAPRRMAPVIDLMQALEKSLAGKEARKPAAKAPKAVAEPERKKRQRKAS